ncbi:MAG: hypothetical protein KDC66_07210 [Phaeodactylibacter sp.]|nr:hypothetical protein [Phaeodactylibacter sp.]MCB9276565.1 hypothetical protein [Lewinellaceae bacterium]
MKRAFWPVVGLFVLLGYGCEPDASEISREARALYGEAQHLHCRLQALHEESVQLWDTVAARLSATLPADMPPDERRNMVAVRNTGLIQMFEVYPTLDTAVHRLVENAGHRDAGLAAQMRAVKDRLDTNEALVRSLLSRMEDRHPSLLPEWKARFDEVHCEDS